MAGLSSLYITELNLMVHLIQEAVEDHTLHDTAYILFLSLPPISNIQKYFSGIMPRIMSIPLPAHLKNIITHNIAQIYLHM
jgi:hypothetical protein